MLTGVLIRHSCASSRMDVIPGVELEDEKYNVKQSLVRNKYAVMDESGTVVLRAKQKLFKVKEEFPFTDDAGNTLFTVKAQNLLDIKGDYAITTPDNEPIATLRKDFTLFVHKWQVLDTEGNQVAVIRSRNKILQVLRSVSGVIGLLFPNKYVIETPDGNEMGSIDGKFSIRDRYAISLPNAETAPREALIAAAIAVDALESN